MGSPQVGQGKDHDHDIQDDVGYLYAQEVMQGINAGFVRNLGVPIGIDGIAIEYYHHQCRYSPKYD